VVGVTAMRVTYRKYDGSLHWNHTAVRLGEDGFGVWVGIGGDVPMFRGAEEWGPPKTPFVILMPRDAWWTASFNAAAPRLPPTTTACGDNIASRGAMPIAGANASTMPWRSSVIIAT